MLLRILLFLLVCSSLSAQEQTLLSQIEGYHELGIRYKERNERANSWYKTAKNYGFEKINKSEYDLVFRYWEDTLLIELTKKDSIVEGYIYNYVIGIKDNSEEEVYLQVDTLNLIDSQLIYHHLTNSKILEIPSSEYVQRWKRDYHYAPYSKIEFYSNKEYFFNTYVALSSQEEFEEVLYIKEFVRHLKNLANYKLNKFRFDQNNLYHCYHFFQAYSVCKIFSRKEYRRRKRELKD